jgi:hypothetical protein
MNDLTGPLFIPADRFQSTLFNRRFDRLIADLIKINHDSAFHIRLKRHVHKQRPW